MSPRRVGVNLLWIVPGEVGGSEEYAVRTTVAVAEHRDDWDPVVMCRPELIEAHPVLGDLEVITRRLPHASRAARIAAENTWLPSTLARLDVDLVHHVGGRMPVRVGAARSVVTIHDLQPLELHDNFAHLKRRYLARAIPRSVARADAVVGVSRHVADQIEGRFSPAAVLTVPAPFESVHLRAAEEPPDELDALGGAPFVLYPAVTHPHKNHGVLLEALWILASEGIGVGLVSTGGHGSAEAAFRRGISRAGLGDRVVRLGRVDRPVLDRLLADAVALVFPSTYEGFGIPLLEAMAANCPIVASDASAVPEVVGDAAELVPPDDARAWADAIRGLVEGTTDREALVARGRHNLGRYTADRSADALAEAYTRAVAGRVGRSGMRSS